jgi:hypothetical protein
MKKINWPKIYIEPENSVLYPRHGLFIRKNKSSSYYLFVLKFPFTGWISINYLSYKMYAASINADLTETYTETGKRKRRLYFNGSLKKGN